jgi:hypothetical protein
MALYIDNLERFKDYLVTISCGNKNSTIDPIQGILLDEDMTLNMSAKFNESDSAMASNFNK